MTLISGVSAHPDGTLVERALRVIHVEPSDSSRLTREVLGIPRAPIAVAERLVVALLGRDPRVGRLGDGRWTMVANPGGSPAVSDSVFAVVDVETTGSVSTVGADRIIEIAVVVVRDSKVETVLDQLVNPGRPIPRPTTNITRITNEMVRRQPTFAEIADEVFAAVAGRVFVAHNVGFDWRFLTAELKRSRGLILEGPRVCTVRLSKKLIRGLKSRSLDSVANYFGVEIDQRHRAGDDARATARVFQRLVTLAEEGGVTTVRELAELGARRSRKHRRKRRAHPTSMDEA